MGVNLYSKKGDRLFATNLSGMITIINIIETCLNNPPVFDRKEIEAFHTFAGGTTAHATKKQADELSKRLTLFLDNLKNTDGLIISNDTDSDDGDKDCSVRLCNDPEHETSVFELMEFRDFLEECGGFEEGF